MSKQVNTVAIGGFVVGALLILLGLAFYIGGGAFRGNSDRAVLVFDGNVKGLKVGAPVAFKGVQIGEVVDIDLVLDTDTYEVMMPVEVRIFEDRVVKIGANQDEDSTEHLLNAGMRGQLQLQSLLTGLLYVQLDFFPDSKVRSFPYETDLDQIPTIQTDLERISRNLQDLDIGNFLQNGRDIIEGLNKLVNDADTQALAGNLNETLTAIEQLSSRLRQEIEAVSPGVNQLIAQGNTTLGTVNQELPALSESAQESMKELNLALEEARSTLEGVDYLLSDDSAVIYDVRQAAQELSAAGRALQSLAETLETQPESILRGKSPLGN